MGHPSAMPWFGGKSPHSGRSVGKWIAEQLPADVSTYAEPFAGMLGVLRQRQPAELEIVNDVDGELMNWWEAVRDHTEELRRQLESTPNSQKLFYDLRDMPADEVRKWHCAKRAWRFTVLVQQSHSCNLTAWQAWWKPDKPGGRKTRVSTFAESLPALADRVRHVHIHNTSAEAILERLADNEDCLVYADPPYPSSAGKTTYKHHQLDVEALLDLFKQQKGKVAISGYPACPWGELGWRHTELKDYCKLAGKDAVTERLWMNYPPVSFTPTLLDQTLP